MEQYKSKLPSHMRSAAEVSPSKPIATACQGSGTHQLDSKPTGKGYGAGSGKVPKKHSAHMDLPHQKYNK